MKKISLAKTFHSLCFSSVLLSGAASAGQVSVSDVENWFEQAVSSPTVPGISVAVADKTGVVFAEGFGYADIENQVAMTPEHKLRIGSVSKLIAAAGMMRLYDQGKLDLDKPITDYVPEWPSKHAPLSLRQLASHTAGVRHYKDGADEFLLNKTYSDISSSLNLFKDDDLLFEPGTDHSYSTFGWTLVSAGMEGADAQRDFRQIIEQEVFEPLKLTHTAFDDQYTLIEKRVRPYSVYEGKLYNSPQTDHSYKWAGGGFISTPSDITRFAVAHLDGHYLNPLSVEAMFTPAKLNSGETVGFGIGWKIGFDDYRQRDKYKNNAEALALMNAMPHAVMHSGGSMGGITMTILCEEHARAVTVVKNVDGDSSADVFLLALKTLSAFHAQGTLENTPHNTSI